MNTKLLTEIQPYVSLCMAIVSSGLAVALAISAKTLIGRKWLIASTTITLLTWPAFVLLPIIANHQSKTGGTSDVRKIFQWFDVFNLLVLFGTACFGLFLFSNWSRPRMKLDLQNLLFSFSGRIPRSVFWISAGILFPLGAILGFVPYTTEAEGLPKVIIWVLYISWSILGVWISLAVYAKRWHDCSRSGWMTLVSCVPLVGPFWLFGYMGFVRGAQGSNQYGDNPLGPSSLTTQPLPAPQTPVSFKFTCPHCGQHISTTSDAVGIEGACPECGMAIVVPSQNDRKA